MKFFVSLLIIQNYFIVTTQQAWATQVYKNIYNKAHYLNVICVSKVTSVLNRVDDNIFFIIIRVLFFSLGYFIFNRRRA